jgi:hypothetical protein
VTLSAYRRISLCLAIVFGIVGVMFLFMSADVLFAIDGVARALGMSEDVPVARSVFVALAVAYMYVVTLLASMMHLHPEQSVYPLLLFNAKGASSVVSLFFFIADRPLLSYLANGIVDGLIGILVLAMYRSCRRGFR